MWLPFLILVCRVWGSVWSAALYQCTVRLRASTRQQAQAQLISTKLEINILRLWLLRETKQWDLFSYDYFCEFRFFNLFVIILIQCKLIRRGVHICDDPDPISYLLMWCMIRQRVKCKKMIMIVIPMCPCQNPIKLTVKAVSYCRLIMILWKVITNYLKQIIVINDHKSSKVIWTII